MIGEVIFYDKIVVLDTCRLALQPVVKVLNTHLQIAASLCTRDVISMQFSSVRSYNGTSV